jgi:hypothetical protein
VARSWIYTLLARYATEGEAAFEPRSRRPLSSPAVIPGATVELIVRLRKERAGPGPDAGPHTIGWHRWRGGGCGSTRPAWCAVSPRT